MSIDLGKLFEVDGNLNEKMVNTILKAINEKHAEGMDYLKFKMSVQNLMAMNMDEVTSVKSAYATASTMGMNKDSLIKSILYYQSIVDDERDDFIKLLKEQIQNKVEDPKVEITDIDKTIKDHQNKIETLQKEIELYKQKQLAIQEEISSQEVKIDGIRKDFLQVYEAFTANLASDKSNFESLL